MNSIAATVNQSTANANKQQKQTAKEVIAANILEIARRYRAAQMAEAPTVPVRIVNLTDAEALEAQLIENVQRRDVHPLEGARGFKALLNVEDPKYNIGQIAAKVGKSPAYCAQLCCEQHKVAYVANLLMW